MDHFLIISITIALIAIGYVWYASHILNIRASQKLLSLETDEDRLLQHWYETMIKKESSNNLNNLQIAAKLLQRMYDINIDSKFLVIGHNIAEQYTSLTGKSFEKEYKSGNDHIFDIRSIIGESGEIAIIFNSRIRAKLNKNSLDLSKIDNIMTNDLDVIARDYLQNLLELRWKRILDLEDSSILNNAGSYVYLHNSSNKNIGDSIVILDNILGLITDNGIRLNLLCSNEDFDLLIKRWNTCILAKS